MEMTNFEKKKFIFLAFLICLIIGCNTEESDWNKIKQSDKISEIELFIKNHPDASHLIDAKNLINLINKKNAFAEVAKTNTIEAYESFFKTYNDSSIQLIINAPNPTHQKVVVVVISNKGLEKKLVEGKAYLWRGQNENVERTPKYSYYFDFLFFGQLTVKEVDQYVRINQVLFCPNHFEYYQGNYQ